MKTECEGCNKPTDVVVDVVIPLPYGELKAEMCVVCSVMINNDSDMLVRLLKNRAKIMKIKLPATKKGLQRLLEG